MYWLNIFHIGLYNHICYQILEVEKVSIAIAGINAGQGGLCQSNICGHLVPCLTGLKHTWQLNIWVLPTESCIVSNKESYWWWSLFQGFSWLSRYNIENVNYQGQRSDTIQIQWEFYQTKKSVALMICEAEYISK